MTNPFDDPDGTPRVLVYGEGQHAPGPAFVAVPGCRGHLSARRTPLRPVSARQETT